MSFFQFLKSPMGADLYKLLSIETQPNEEDWLRHQRWWDDNVKKLQLKLNKRGAFDEYHEFVAWRSQMFMATYWDFCGKVRFLNVLKILSTNQ